MDGPRQAYRAARPHWPGMLGAGLLATFVFTVPGAAQNLADVQRELSEMRRHYDAELKRLQRDYDARIRHLEAQLRATQKKSAPDVASSAKQSPKLVAAAVAPPSPANTASSDAPLVPSTPAPASPLAFTISTPPHEPWPVGPVTPPIGANPSASAGSFNPTIGVILQGKQALSAGIRTITG